jgi:ketosteroid isomerase-like protein
MTAPDVPAAVRAFVDATNRGDSEAFVAAFTDDAHLDDWGREFRGREGILGWNRTDNIGVAARFELIDAKPGPEPDSHVVTLKVTSNRHNGTGPMTFRLRDGLIADLRIS